MSSKEDSLKIRINVSPQNVSLFEALQKYGPYYRSRRLVQLALLGLSVEQGLSSTLIKSETATTGPANNMKTKPSAEQEIEVGQVRDNHYTIPKDGGNDLSEFFDFLEK